MIRNESICRSASQGRWRLPLALLVSAVLLAAFGSTALARAASGIRHARQTQSGTPVPPGFVGVDFGGAAFNLNLGQETKTMVANGVESMRVAFDWSAAQPYASFGDIPATDSTQYTNVGGVPTNFAPTDSIVAAAAQHGLTVLPTILYATSWDATANPSGGLPTPTQAGPFAAFAAALVGRYGPNGSFWSSNPGIPRLPIRMWQIWNEPNIAYYWPQPFAQGYAALLRAAHGAIKSADPGAKVVLAALTNAAWVSLGKLHGIKHQFDVAAVNGFTKHPANVILYLRLMRRAMNALGYRHKALLGTELSWPAAAGKHTSQQFDFDVTQRGQAQNIATLLPMLGQQRKSLGLMGFYYYTWVGDESPGHHDLAFDFAGLEGYSSATGRTFSKPALRAFSRAALALEQCKRKSNLATRCAQR